MRIARHVLPLAVALAGCSSAPTTQFAGTYTGTLTETYTCTCTSSSTCESMSPAPFQLEGQTFTLTQLGSDVFVAIGSCPGSDLAGDSDGDVVNLNAASQATASCAQTDPTGSVAIQISAFGSGTLTLTGGTGLVVSLPETATITDQTCTGTATGTLTLQ